MQQNQLEKELLSLKCAEASYPFGPDAQVFKVMGKMFALLSQNKEAAKVTLKCAPPDGEVLVSEFDAVRPGYHMNKRHWITITLAGDLPDGFIIDLAEKSYGLVVGKLTKSDRNKLALSMKVRAVP